MNRTKRSRFGKKKAVRKNRTLRRRKGGNLNSIETLDAIEMSNINQSIEQETRECYEKSKTAQNVTGNEKNKNTVIFNFFRSANKEVFDQKKLDECDKKKKKKKICLNSVAEKLKNESHNSNLIKYLYDEKCALDGGVVTQ